MERKGELQVCAAGVMIIQEDDAAVELVAVRGEVQGGHQPTPCLDHQAVVQEVDTCLNGLDGDKELQPSRDDPLVAQILHQGPSVNQDATVWLGLGHDPENGLARGDTHLEGAVKGVFGAQEVADHLAVGGSHAGETFLLNVQGKEVAAIFCPAESTHGKAMAGCQIPSRGHQPERKLLCFPGKDHAVEPVVDGEDVVPEYADKLANAAWIAQVEAGCGFKCGVSDVPGINPLLIDRVPGIIAHQ